MTKDIYLRSAQYTSSYLMIYKAFNSCYRSNFIFENKETKIRRFIDFDRKKFSKRIQRDCIFNKTLLLSQQIFD